MLANVIASMALVASIGQAITFDGGTEAQQATVAAELALPDVPAIVAPISVVLGPNVPNFGGCSGLVVNTSWDDASFTWALAHEYGHVWDCQVLTNADRDLFAAAVGKVGIGWRDGDYASRLDESFASAYADWLWVKLGRIGTPRYAGTDAVAAIVARHAVEDILPDTRPILRGELASLLVDLGYSSAPVRSFSDIPLGSPHYSDVTAAAGAGMFVGYVDGTFRPDSPASAYEIGLVLGRVADYAMR